MRAGPRQPGWRRRLRRGIGWMLLVKLAALAALWILFFAPADRPQVTAERLGGQLALEPEKEAPRD
jgi:hypothetical protein